MTDTPSAKGTNISSDTDRTSPLSELPTSSPSITKSDLSNTKQMTVDTEADNTTVNTHENGKNGDVLPKEERSRSIISDESSELSDLDSDAETERMYGLGDSKLKKLAKVNEDGDEDITHEVDEDETTLQPKHDKDNDGDGNFENDQFIKDEVIDELSDHKNEEIKTPMDDEDISKVVESMKKEEELKTNGVKDSNKRKLDDDDNSLHSGNENDDNEEEASKRQKLSKNHMDVSNKDSNEVVEEAEAEGDDEEADETNIAHNEDDDEAEDEDEENDVAAEEEEEEELTEEQKEQRQKELEIELKKQKERKEALDFLTEIEVDFAKLRDRLYEDKMERFKSELAMCLNGSHPELQTVYTKIDSHREEKTKLAELDRKYKLESITRKTIAQRTQVHQQFYKLVFDSKNKLLKEITEEWYKINKERRTMDLLVPEYSYRIPEYTDELVYQRQQLNEEISLLVGLNQYYGFPKAPQLKPVEGQELDDDLRAMNIIL